MNSSTSNSDPHRSYVLRLGTLVLAPVLGLFALGVYLQPLSGDLTRIGSYAEKDFGWNKPQLEFTNPQLDVGVYDRYHDVVVLGDSFSTGATRRYWQNYLVADTGWSLVTLDVNKIRLEHVLRNQVFRETPPRLFVYETVERELPHRLENDQAHTCAGAELPQNGKLDSPHFPVSMAVPSGKLVDMAKSVDRNTDWSAIRLGYVLSYIRNSLLRIMVGDANTDAAKVELSRSAPFSSSEKRAMLVYKDDFNKVEWWKEMGLPEMSCRIARMRSQVEVNGHTRFVLMVAPDKLSAYSDYLHDKELREVSLLPELASRLPEVMPRLDLTLIAAIRRGEQDVYMPNDTHWGSTGYQIAAETLLAFLRHLTTQ